MGRKRQRDRQLRAVYDFISKYIEENGLAPSLDNIAAGCFMARSTALRYLDMLEGRGYINRMPNIPRSIVIVKKWKT